LLVTGDPDTVKSEAGALNPTLLTEPVPGNVCPEAKLIRPFAAMFNPVSLGAAPLPNKRFSVADGVVLLLPVGSACHWNVDATAFFVLLLNAEADKSSGWESKPLLAVAVPVAGKLRVPRKVEAPLTSSVVAGVVVLIPILAVFPLPD
jgi:hypothetical protein